MFSLSIFISPGMQCLVYALLLVNFIARLEHRKSSDSMQGHTMNLYLRANPSSKAANTCSFALDHPAPSFKSSSLKKRLVLQILVVAIRGG